MSTIPVRIGVPQIFLSVDDPTIVPDATGLVFTASAVTPDAGEFLLNDVNQALLPTDTYQVILGLVGRDPKGGYTVGACSASTGNITVASGQVIQVNVPNVNWPANFTYAIAAVLFLKTNGGNFQLCQFSYIDPNDDFRTHIMAKPLRVAPSFATVVLQTKVSDPILGPRNGLGITYQELTPTTGTFNFKHPVTNVTVSPNTGADFVVTSTRSVSVEFQTLANDIKTLVQAAAGNYVSYTSGANTWKEARQSLSTAQVILRGNRPLQVFLPIDQTGAQEVRLLMGNLTVNQQELSLAFSKTATTPVSFRLDAAALDKLITNQHTEIAYLKQ